MPEANIPKNLPTEGKSLLESVEETKKQEEKQPTEVQGSSSEPEPRPELAPQKPSTAESAEADDIFADVKETKPSSAESSSDAEAMDDKTESGPALSIGEPTEKKEEGLPGGTIV